MCEMEDHLLMKGFGQAHATKALKELHESQVIAGKVAGMGRKAGWSRPKLSQLGVVFREADRVPCPSRHE